MTTALDILNKFEKVDVLASAQRAIENTADSAVKEQKSQLAQGLKADGTFQPNYSPRSVSVFGKTPGPIKLFDTGAYYAGLRVEVRGDLFSINSTDSKEEYLENKYNPLGLGVLAKTNYITVLEPEFIRQIKSYLK